MLKRAVHLSVASLTSILLLACAGGEEDPSNFGSFSTSPNSTSMDGMDDMDDEDGMDGESGDSEAEGQGDGDGDGGPSTGDGDGDPSTGDGDGDKDPDTGDGDGDTTGDGDGDGDPANCGNGVIDPGETCDGANFGGVTCVDLGYDSGALSCNACAVDPSGCMNAPQPGLGQLYSHCLASANCPGLDVCITLVMEGDDTPLDGFCTNGCTSNSECETNTGGSAIPQCNDEPNPFCELDCSGGKTCPAGMECTSLVGGKSLCF